MTDARTMLAATWRDAGYPTDDLAACIAACFDCSQTCSACADACLAEMQVADLRRCITLNLNCADICALTGRVLTRQTEAVAAVNESLLMLCATACQECAEECARHEEMAHRELCSTTCLMCGQACRQLLAAISE